MSHVDSWELERPEGITHLRLAHCTVILWKATGGKWIPSTGCFTTKSHEDQHIPSAMTSQHGRTGQWPMPHEVATWIPYLVQALNGKMGLAARISPDLARRRPSVGMSATNIWCLTRHCRPTNMGIQHDSTQSANVSRRFKWTGVLCEQRQLGGGFSHHAGRAAKGFKLSYMTSGGRDWKGSFNTELQWTAPVLCVLQQMLWQVLDTQIAHRFLSMRSLPS